VIFRFPLRTWAYLDWHRYMDRSRRQAYPVAACLKADADRDGLLAYGGMLPYLHRYMQNKRAGINLSIEIEAGVMLLDRRCA
jgi:hypothetical protein